MAKRTLEKYELDFIDKLSEKYQELVWTTPWDGRYETTMTIEFPTKDVFDAKTKDFDIYVESSYGSYMVIVKGNAQQWEINTDIYEDDPDNDYTILHLYNKIRDFYESHDKQHFFETLTNAM